VFKWDKHFAQGRDSLEDDGHTSRPRMFRTELKYHEIATSVRANRSQIVDEARAVAWISHNIVSDDLN
jgi:hypothetical protein